MKNKLMKILCIGAFVVSAYYAREHFEDTPALNDLTLANVEALASSEIMASPIWKVTNHTPSWRSCTSGGKEGC